MHTLDRSITHPADALASIRREIKQLEAHADKLKAGLIADRESRVGVEHHAVVDRRTRETVDWRGVVSDLRQHHSRASAPPVVGDSVRAWADRHAARMAEWDAAMTAAITARTRTSEYEQVTLEAVPDLREVLRLLDGPCAYVDVETTGFSAAAGDRVISLGLYQPPGADPDSTGEEFAFSSVFDPEGRRSTPQALAVHGLTDEALACAPTFPELADEILVYLRGTTLIAHNSPFDVGFLKSEFERAGVEFPALAGVVDTRLLSKLLWPSEPASLDAVCERLGIPPRTGTHDALGDSRRVAEGVRAMRPLLEGLLAGHKPPVSIPEFNARVDKIIASDPEGYAGIFDPRVSTPRDDSFVVASVDGRVVGVSTQAVSS